MSSPIADTVEYFSEKSQSRQRSTAHSMSGHTLPPDAFRREDLLAPQSSENRQNMTVGPISYSRYSQNHYQSEGFDPRNQWRRAFKKLSSLGDDGESASDQSETYELSAPRTMEDDVLPSPFELEEQQKQQDTGDGQAQAQATENSYFARPFPDDKARPEPRAPKPPSPTHPPPTTPKDSIPTQGGPTKARDRPRQQWNKTLDKIRLITTLPNVPQRSRPTDTGIVSSLAPYYQPVFDPLFLAISKDEHGRKVPPILVQCLHVDVTDSKLLTHGIDQWVFRVELQYGDIKWIVFRTIADFVALHYKLRIKSNLSEHVPAPPNFPSQLQNWINSAKETLRIDREEEGAVEKEKAEALNRRKALATYLRNLLERAHMMFSYDICEFLEISAVSIVQDMGWKGKEGYMENRIKLVSPGLCMLLRPHLWKRNWVILRDSYVAFCTDIASKSPTDVLLVDRNFIYCEKTPGLIPGRYHYHIVLKNESREIELKGSRRQVKEWTRHMDMIKRESPWVKNHRFSSFAPVRSNAKVKWYIDAEDHFNAVAEAILSAKSEIYIADWWLSPELYLRRPPEKNEDFRLDRLLQRKAREGVMIYVVIYKEMAIALTINSVHTKHWLQALHPNIIVQRHPDHRSVDNSVLFWSHHEKMIIVDNRLAFIGGLDLCWGRYDTHAHRLADYPAAGDEPEIFPGQDYSNPRVKDFANVAEHTLTLVNREKTARMPWHDMGIGTVGPVARDIARHFIQRWNFLKASKGTHRPNVPFLMPKGEYVATRDESKFKGTCRVQMLRSSAQWSSGIEREHSIYNAYMECISKSKHFIYIENQFFISATTNDKLLRNKIGQAIVERIKRAHEKGEKYKVFIMIPLIPAFEGDLASSDASSARTVMHFQYISISRGGNSIIEKLREDGIDPSEYIGWYCLRNWDKIAPRKGSKTDSGAIFGDQMPTQGTPCEAGDTGRASQSPSASSSSLSWATSEPHSATSGPSPDETASQEIDDEEDDREQYVSELVYIHDKLLIVDDRIVLVGSANINDRSQLGNRDSEVAMLIEDTDMVPSSMNGQAYQAAKFALTLRMQLWKEHLGLLDFTDWSKLMNEDVPSAASPATPTMPRHQHLPAATEEDIRKFELKGPDCVLDHERRSTAPNTSSDDMMDRRVLDPLSDHFYHDIWRKTAETNTLIYRKLFRCVPDDTVHTFEQHRQFLPDPTKVPHGHVADPDLSGHEIRKQLANVRGHLVQFPTEYLKDEKMLGSMVREAVTPMIIFT